MSNSERGQACSHLRLSRASDDYSISIGIDAYKVVLFFWCCTELLLHLFVAVDIA